MAIEKEGLSGDRVQQEEVAWGEDVAEHRGSHQCHGKGVTRLV